MGPHQGGALERAARRGESVQFYMCVGFKMPAGCSKGDTRWGVACVGIDTEEPTGLRRASWSCSFYVVFDARTVVAGKLKAKVFWGRAWRVSSVRCC